MTPASISFSDYIAVTSVAKAQIFNYNNAVRKQQMEEVKQLLQSETRFNSTGHIGQEDIQQRR